jgi:hypothetical protein
VAGPGRLFLGAVTGLVDPHDDLLPLVWEELQHDVEALAVLMLPRCADIVPEGFLAFGRIADREDAVGRAAAGAGLLVGLAVGRRLLARDLLLMIRERNALDANRPRRRVLAGQGKGGEGDHPSAQAADGRRGRPGRGPGRPVGLGVDGSTRRTAVNVAPQPRSQARSIARAGDTSSLRSEPLSGGCWRRLQQSRATPLADISGSMSNRGSDDAKRAK